MDKVEAYCLIQKEIEKYQDMNYSELELLIDKPICSEITAQSTKLYQLEVQVMWDDKPKENIRVITSIDDMSWYAFSPMSESFIIQPDSK